MSDEAPPPSKRVKLTRDDLDRLSKEEVIERWMEQEAFVEALMSRQMTPSADELTTLRETEEKLKQQQSEASHRENVLVMRLTAKEQEMQECLNQIQELKSVQNASMAQLRATLLDPAVNIMFQRMKKENEASKEKLEQAQNDLTAWKFTTDSQTGKRLMAKCRQLLQENEELGKVISAGRTAKLQGEIALQKKFVEEMKKSQAETDEFLVEMDEDVEGMQSTIYYLQQQLKETKAELVALQAENERLKMETSPPGNGTATAAPCTHNMTVTSSTSADDSNLKTTGHGAVTTSSPTDKNRQLLRTPLPEGNEQQTAEATNGDHHIEMDYEELLEEADQQQEQQQSCSDGAAASASRTDTATPPPQKHTVIHNSAGHRTSLSSVDGTYTTTDVSNEEWSPVPSKQISGSPVSDDEMDTGLVSTEDARTESKSEGILGSDSLQNGLVVGQCEDSEATECNP